jgi:hypothetical protein
MYPNAFSHLTFPMGSPFLTKNRLWEGRCSWVKQGQDGSNRVRTEKSISFSAWASSRNQLHRPQELGYYTDGHEGEPLRTGPGAPQHLERHRKYHLSEQPK